MNQLLKFSWFILLLMLLLPSRAQELHESPFRSGIYHHLGELATLQLISLNTACLPLSHSEIRHLLLEAQARETESQTLNRRQAKELNYYLAVYGSNLQENSDTLGFYLSDLIRGQGFNLPTARYDLLTVREGDFSLCINPVLGYGKIYADTANMFRRWNGIEAYASKGKHWSFYASLRDNHESIRLSDPNYLNDFQGANYKPRGLGGDFSEMLTGITYAWDWGYFSFRKDHFIWGNNVHGANIFSGHQPSFPFVELSLKPVKWFQFRYIHGWMVSEIIDSNRTYPFYNPYGGGTRLVFVPKNLAANMISVRPFKNTWISVGNSVVYSDLATHPAFLLPLGFFKSIDHTITGTGSNWLGQNSQMFADVSIREIRKVHIYSTLFVDEISFSNIWDEENSSNFLSIKAGLTLTDLPLPNLSWSFEYTRNNPLTYQHNIPTTSFSSNNYTLGHYLRDNSQEVYAQLQYRPARNLFFSVWALDAKRGPDYNTIGGDLHGLPFLEEVVWSHTAYGTQLSWEIINNLLVKAGVSQHTYGGTGDGSDFNPSMLAINGLQFDFSLQLGR
jgi:hypothetical protein